MKTASILLAVFALHFVGCADKMANEHGHEHEAGGLEPLAYTLYSAKTELFVEFKPLVKGSKSNFAAHFTILGEQFLPLTKGKVTVSLIVNESGIRNSADSASSPGIFRLALVPKTAGKGKLVFDINTESYTDQIVIEDITVFADEQSALDNQTETAVADEITYLKEQAWKVEFANAPVQRQSFTEIIKTGGTILSKPKDEKVIISQISGTLSLDFPNLVSGTSVRAGQNLFTVRSTEITESEINTNLSLAKEALRKSKEDYDRGRELVRDQIISQKDFLDIEKQYNQALISVTNEEVVRKFNNQQQLVSAPLSGFISTILVENGQYVAVGTPLAVVSRNQKLILQAGVSQKYFSKLPTISSANFKPVGSEQVFDTKMMNGKIISFGKSVAGNSAFLPITFEIDNIGNLVPGSVAEVFLRSSPIPNSLVIPFSALMEEQGNFYVYVQTGGESFQKREIKIGSSDGENVQVLSGIEEGVRVVTKGGYQIKLSSASAELPAHGHEH